MMLRVIKLTLAAVVLAVCFCGQNKGDTGESRKNDSDTAKSASQIQGLESGGAVDTSIVDSLPSPAQPKDEPLVSVANDTVYDLRVVLRDNIDSFFQRKAEMRSPAKKRKWLEDRFPSVVNASDSNRQASGEITESYPDEINCVINSVIPEYAQWEEFKYRPDSPMIDLLYFTSAPIRPVSFRMFKLSGKSSHRACIWVEIWKMKSLSDVRKVNTLIYNDHAEWEMEFGLYSPKSHFAFNEYFILIHGCSYEVDKRIFGINKHLRKECFSCGALDGESPKEAGNKYSCYSDKVLFGQNDKDW